LLHDRVAHDWSLEELAKEVAMSRTVLAERFQHFVGQPPMRYLARWRMQLASSLLSEGKLSFAEIADRIGYGSETAFSRAFKREVGMAPALWRDRQAGVEATSAAASLTTPAIRRPLVSIV
jgi:AraC-like DNA-binding protein